MPFARRSVFAAVLADTLHLYSNKHDSSIPRKLQNFVGCVVHMLMVIENSPGLNSFQRSTLPKFD
jgi:hypothetical protein